MKNKNYTQTKGQATLSSYVNGFLLSVILTLTAYILVVQHTLSTRVILAAIVTLAMVQFLVQLFFFLHLGRETKPRWKLVVFGFMITVVCILVFGSLWIMSNLNYQMTTQQINSYMNRQDGL
jgi:cytochrome o ubiquinol oxidase subunit IV